MPKKGEGKKGKEKIEETRPKI